MHFVFKMKNFLFKMMIFVFKMIDDCLHFDCAGGPRLCLHRL